MQSTIDLEFPNWLHLLQRHVTTLSHVHTTSNCFRISNRVLGCRHNTHSSTTALHIARCGRRQGCLLVHPTPCILLLGGQSPPTTTLLPPWIDCIDSSSLICDSTFVDSS
ncbi:hypothetical protein K432DRAFT_237156 [Lepidopterella palustris CBS 459.81]|uniref:Uncharacterized protein n=1 Tax=Lepidopterella palustris CBS 459.81 TaxID=1314670 RepID=A0A8E2JGT4_9PEZI|nr:hypothetical protein K432DRAFT_237156 [Lepidopterella palustris CBS 459.81]